MKGIRVMLAGYTYIYFSYIKQKTTTKTFFMSKYNVTKNRMLSKIEKQQLFEMGRVLELTKQKIITRIFLYSERKRDNY